jgi:pentose-5-phosphate-3-epimerase
MTINEVFAEAIQSIKGQSMYAGQFYSPQGVIAVIEDIQSKVVGNGVIGVVPGNTKPTLTITKEMYDNLVERLEEIVSDNIISIDVDGLVDKESIELSISGREVSIDNFDIEMDQIASEATWGISTQIEEWTDEYGIQVVKTSKK